MHERVLATRRDPAAFYSLYDMRALNLSPAWSVDGRLIAVFEYTAGSETRVSVFDVVTGAAHGIPVKGLVTGLAWLDTASLVLNRPPEEGAASQLFRLSYPDGRLSRLSNDPNAYAGVSVTADGTSLATARSETRVGIWVGDAMGRKGTEAISPMPYPAGTYRMLAWTADRLLYGTEDRGNFSISRISPGKGPPEEILSGAMLPATTWDGQAIVFWNFKTESLWKADSDGRQAVELVPRTYLPTYPVVTPHGQVVFVSRYSGVQAPWIVSLEGGSPRELAHVLASAGSMDVSPDGKSLMFWSRDKQNQGITMICDLPDCTHPQSLPAFGRINPLRWTPDGSIAYIEAAAPSNIWVRPLDGRPPYQLTQFADRTIVDFAWSRDGKQLAIARASTTNDIVLFTGLKK
jgi:WD40 repeat protein